MAQSTVGGRTLPPQFPHRQAIPRRECLPALGQSVPLAILADLSASAGAVRKGEKGTQIVFYKQLHSRTQKERETEEERDRAPFVLCYFTVSNVEQCDGLTLPPILPSSSNDMEKDETCEAIVKRMGEPPYSSTDQRQRTQCLLSA